MPLSYNESTNGWFEPVLAQGAFSIMISPYFLDLWEAIAFHLTEVGQVSVIDSS